MERMKVGIYAPYFLQWGGGIDFIAAIAMALEASGKAETYLVLKENSVFLSLFRFGKNWLKTLLTRKNAFQESKLREEKCVRAIYEFECQSPKTKKIFFKQSFFDELKKLEKCLRAHDIDILFPVGGCPLPEKFSLPWIGYLPDFQHKYLTDLFSKEEINKRNSLFGKMLRKARFVVVNAKAVESDIRKFYPAAKTDIIVLPFKPWQKPDIKDILLSKYNLPKKYLIVSSQFWQHKSHATVFDALELLYSRGITDVHVVCTGKLEDYRNPEYISNLRDHIGSLMCRNNIHLLGYIPKDDQLKIMSGATGLVQPSLFEGGPGAGGVIHAIGLGLPCFVSDIDVNKEIVGYDKVYFFEKGNAHSLADLLESHISEKRIPYEMIEPKLRKNLSEYGDYIVEKLERCKKLWSIPV